MIRKWQFAKQIATSLEKFNSLKDKPTELNEAL